RKAQPRCVNAIGIVTGRRTLWLTLSLIFEFAKKSGGGAICLFFPVTIQSLYGEKVAAAG
ncbi:hypothetical protein, partial [Mesorhizobium sp.]|uniref:hypothetical protein n=1 Tax=Mesorhizobium sp. TaxID=1871066 RepID=UPI0025D4A39B